MSITFLIGPRGCGKTLIARRMEERYGCRVCDTDTLIFETSGKTVAEIVAESGWEYFRSIEKDALAEAVERTAIAPGAKFPAVIATGGGMVLALENRAFMREKGRVVYLAAPPSVLVSRLSFPDGDASRPSLFGLPLAEEVEKVLEERDPLYRETAHHVLDASLPPEEVARILYETVILPASRDKDSI